MTVAATYVILFIIFGTFLEKSGAGQFFMNFANAIAGGARGGPGKVAVVSSSLFGTISGSAVANVMVDGWLTIPMMKKTGFKPEAAAAIEAVASTGGQIMPPIMGAAAFVMAEFQGVSYTQVMIAAAIPALFYYGALFAAIHFNAVRSGLKGLPREELPILGHIMLRQGHLFLPVIVLLALLLYGFTPTYGAIIATVALVAISWLRPSTGLGWRACLEGLRDGAVQTVPVAMACASAGIVIGIVLQTGLALRFTASSSTSPTARCCPRCSSPWSPASSSAWACRPLPPTSCRRRCSCPRSSSSGWSRWRRTCSRSTSRACRR